ncbi:MAG: hypothetical protein ACR2RF_28310 [Geminicoccaceae bacterium]
MQQNPQTPSEPRDGVHEALTIPLSKVCVMTLPCGSSLGQWWSNNFMIITVLLAKKIRQAVKIKLSNEECMSTVQTSPFRSPTMNCVCSIVGTT